jgi:hypothetical protein
MASERKPDPNAKPPKTGMLMAGGALIVVAGLWFVYSAFAVQLGLREKTAEEIKVEKEEEKEAVRKEQEAKREAAAEARRTAAKAAAKARQP